MQVSSLKVVTAPRMLHFQNLRLNWIGIKPRRSRTNAAAAKLRRH
jgi:hypothetical protein